MDFKNIKIIIWDFDGTFYKPDQKLWQDVREAEYKTIMNHNGWDRIRTEIQFAKLHKVKIASATEVVARLTGLSVKTASLDLEQYFDRRLYLSKDRKLIRLFADLKPFRHFILGNGVRHRIEEALDILGIPIKTFEEIVTSETVGVNKPNPEGYQYILNKTGLPPEQHLMVGDREVNDLATAKSLDMKTCLVWSDNPGNIADATLPKVYDIGNLLL